MPNVQSNIHFLAKDDIYKEEKPYSLRYPSEDELPQTNFSLEKHESITIHDLRGRESTLSYRQNGFTVIHLDSQMTYEDFGSQEKIKTVFLKEVGAMLRNVLGASIVQALEHIVRKRDPEFPISTGRTYHYNQLTAMAHIDATPSCTVDTIKNLNQEKASDYLKYRFQCFNVWKPLRGPLRDWPLALCDPSTIEADTDLMPADLVCSDYVVENYQVHFAPKQKWYYLDNQLPSEIIVFRQTDSDPRAGPGVPHSSFENPLSLTDEPPRESIEARFVVYYE